MFTQCPNCETIFAVRREHLEVRQGLVRCGRCREVFNASWNLVDRLPDAEVAGGDAPTPAAVAADEAYAVDELGPSPPVGTGEATLTPALSDLLEPSPHAPDPAPPPQAESPAGDGGSERDDPHRVRQQRDAVPKPPGDESSAPQSFELGAELPETPPVPPAHRGRRAGRHGAVPRRHPAPGAGARTPGRQRRSHRRRSRTEATPAAARWLDFTGPLAKATRWPGLMWSVVALLLVAGLGWQVRTFYLTDLAVVAPLRPLLAGFCHLSRCALPPRQDLGRIDLVETGILPHPDMPGALRVSASFVNRADFAQRYPLVQVTLTDKIGNIVGRRAYLPREYLIPGRRELTMLTPNVVEVVSLDLAYPHEKAVGYEIELVAAPPG